MSGASRDLAHALRAAARVPVLSAVVIVSIALGIGLNAVVFSWIQARMLRPLPGVPDASRFYGIEPRSRLGQYTGASWLEYQELRRTLHLVHEPIASRMTPLYVGEPGRVERASGALVSANYFSGLGLRPAAGRFPRTDEAEGGAPVAVISHDL